MARKTRKTRTSKPKPARTKQHAEPGRLSRWLTADGADPGRPVRMALWATLLVVLIGGGAVMLSALQSYVMRQPGFADSLAEVVLVDTPDYMNDYLVHQLQQEITPDIQHCGTFDPQLCRRVYERASASPWIARVRQVRIERTGAENGVVASRVVVSAEFRRPAARVQYIDGRTGQIEWAFVDTEGVVLPAHQIGSAATKLVIVQGLSTRPPQAGQLWQDPALAYGLDWLELMTPRPWFEEIHLLNVANYDRHDPAQPAVVALAQNGRSQTLIKLGRLLEDGFAVSEPAPQVKLSNLDAWYHRQGTLVGREFINVMDARLFASSY